MLNKCSLLAGRGQLPEEGFSTFPGLWPRCPWRWCGRQLRAPRACPGPAPGFLRGPWAALEPGAWLPSQRSALAAGRACFNFSACPLKLETGLWACVCLSRRCLESESARDDCSRLAGARQEEHPLAGARAAGEIRQAGQLRPPAIVGSTPLICPESRVWPNKIPTNFISLVPPESSFHVLPSPLSWCEHLASLRLLSCSVSPFGAALNQFFHLCSPVTSGTRQLFPAFLFLSFKLRLMFVTCPLFGVARGCA